MSSESESRPAVQSKKRWYSLRDWQPSLGTAFRSILIARMISAFTMHISDCDETFNYWEPFHYVCFRSGFQTWEYSPVYALRSYAYLLLHLIPMQIVQAGNKIVVFYMLRVVFALFCTVCEFYFYRAVLQRFGATVAKWTLIFLCGSVGMYVASTAFLPTSFAMYLTMVSMGAWFIGNYELAIFAVALSSLLGWPFSAAIGIPIAVDAAIKQREYLFFIFWASLSFAVISVPMVIIDTIYYGKFVFAPWNILRYNVFGKGGPDLYGVEPWSFYFVNGFLNFNIVFVLALLAVFLIEIKVFIDTLSSSPANNSWIQVLYSSLLQYSGVRESSASSNSKSLREATQSMIIWIMVFFTRPHKEERFLFPIYPLFCLAAALTVELIPQTAPTILGLLRVPRAIKKLVNWSLGYLPTTICWMYILVSLSRGYALYSGYHAPMEVYRDLNYDNIKTIVQPIYSDINVCVGKEWYRFPSHFFLPGHRWKLRFLKSSFKGQLPKHYLESANGSWVVPADMNDMNKEEPSRYFDIAGCHFLVDLDLPHSSADDPAYVRVTKTWKIITSHPFMDASRSHRFFRAFYVPYFTPRYVTYADYNLMLNKVLFERLKLKLTPDYPKSFL